MKSYKGINSGTTSINSNEVVPTALYHRLLDNLEFQILYKTNQKGWTFLGSDSRSSDSAPPVYTTGAPYRTALAGGMVDRVYSQAHTAPHTTPAVDYVSQLGGLEFSTPPWEPMTIPIPFRPTINTKEIEITITGIVGVPEGTTHGGSMWAWAEFFGGRIGSSGFTIKEPLRINYSAERRFVTPEPTLHETFVGSSEEEIQELFDNGTIIKMDLPPNPNQPGIWKIKISLDGIKNYNFNGVDPSQEESFIYLNFLSTRSDTPALESELRLIAYRKFLTIDRQWDFDWGIGQPGTKNRDAGKAHYAISIEDSSVVGNPRWYYPVQMRPSGMVDDKNTPYVNPYINTVEGNFHNLIQFDIYPQIETAFDVSISNLNRAVGFEFENEVKIYPLTFFKLFNFSINEIKEIPEESLFLYEKKNQLPTSSVKLLTDLKINQFDFEIHNNNEWTIQPPPNSPIGLNKKDTFSERGSGSTFLTITNSRPQTFSSTIGFVNSEITLGRISENSPFAFFLEIPNEFNEKGLLRTFGKLRDGIGKSQTSASTPPTSWTYLVRGQSSLIGDIYREPKGGLCSTLVNLRIREERIPAPFVIDLGTLFAWRFPAYNEPNIYIPQTTILQDSNLSKFLNYLYWFLNPIAEQSFLESSSDFVDVRIAPPAFSPKLPEMFSCGIMNFSCADLISYNSIRSTIRSGESTMITEMPIETMPYTLQDLNLIVGDYTYLNHVSVTTWGAGGYVAQLDSNPRGWPLTSDYAVQGTNVRSRDWFEPVSSDYSMSSDLLENDNWIFRGELTCQTFGFGKKYFNLIPVGSRNATIDTEKISSNPSASIKNYIQVFKVNPV